MSASELLPGSGGRLHESEANKAINEEDTELTFEGFEKEVPVDPLLALLYARHTLTSPYSTSEERQAAMSAMNKEMLEHNMAPYLRIVREALELTLDEAKLQEMDAINTAKVEAIDAKLRDAQENLGDTEVRDVLQAKCDHYARIGDFEACLKFNEECAAKTLAVGRKLDLYFQRIRLGIAFSDNEVAAKGIRDAHRLMIGGDWERRNRLKVYEGVYHVMVRDFRRGSELLLDCITTFASGELISFKDFIFITVIASLPVLSRSELKRRIIDSPEVISADLPELCDFVNAIHACRYRDVFPALDVVCQKQRLIVYVSPHVNYFFRKTRVLVFTQFLDSYSSVTLQSMASTFGIPLPVLDQMLCTLIANESIACKMDRVNNSITTYRGNTTNFDYHNIIKNGDLLLNRIQKLSRLVEM
ncbi:unnamed protein product [Phytomonas sp. EM1]|nr:unnamed protein product [Phytomonas sp. EM1]|eukprot:CCW60362.1 unnamed protein product [Phytomonas sp. isolate EM1]